MKKLSFALLLCCFFFQISIAQETTPKWSRATVIQQIEDFYESEQVMGMAISISVDSVLVLSEGYGYVDMNKTKKVNPSTTMFRIASLSKPITGTCLGVLVDQNRIAFDESVYKYVSDFPKKKYDFTLRQLAAHTSGIRHYKWYEKENKKDISIEEGMKKFKRSKLKFKPGSQYSYSSYAYNLLGLAIEKAVNEDFFSIVKTNVLEPLSMTNTIVDDGDYTNEEVSGFFKKNKKGIKEQKDVNIYFKLPSGGFLSTSEDLIRLGNSYIYSSLLSAETQAAILEQQPVDGGKTTYGLGWGVSKDKKGRTFYSHSGGGVGAVSRILVYPEEKLCITMVVNTNCDYFKQLRMIQQIADHIMEGHSDN
jgi:CubicO group peptidase (beta-lactamase class C family)